MYIIRNFKDIIPSFSLSYNLKIFHTSMELSHKLKNNATLNCKKAICFCGVT